MGKDLAGRWGHYFLRYSAGTVVGAIIVWFLAPQLLNVDDPLSKYIFAKSLEGNTEIGAAAITILIGLGFTYCYIASAPGAVFHAARGLFYNRNITSIPKYLFYILLSSLILFLFCIYPSSYFVPTLSKTTWLLFAGFVVGVFVFLLQCVLLFRIYRDFDHVRKFYKEMTCARSKMKEQNNVGHYVKSYRDLREHGNAFEIIILELILAATLLLLKDYCLIVLCVWILPAAFCWIIATLLEFKIPPAES